MKSWRMRLIRLIIMPTRVGLYIGSLLGIPHSRFVTLPERAKRALEKGDNLLARRNACELLALANRYQTDWNYGNAIHHGHLVLGRLAFGAGDVIGASAELLLAGQTPGSPQLNSFGPNMRLAQELLGAGQRDVVLEYIELCRRFWQKSDARLDGWIADITEGRTPSFGPNLVY